MKNFPRFKGKAVYGGHEVKGYGCYTDDSSKQYVITDSPVPKTFIEVEEVIPMKDEETI